MMPNIGLVFTGEYLQHFSQMYGGGIFDSNCVPFNSSDWHLFTAKSCSRKREIRNRYISIFKRPSDQKWTSLFNQAEPPRPPKALFMWKYEQEVCGQNVWIVPFYECHCFYEWGKYIHWYFYSPSFSSFENHEWGMQQRICHLIFIKYANGTSPTET